MVVVCLPDTEPATQARKPHSNGHAPMHYNLSTQEIRRAKHPHELFLINLVTNHILLFVGLLGLAKTYPYLLLTVPAISFAVLIYTMIRARRSLRTDPWFVYCHWQLGARRSRFFIFMMLIMMAVILLVLLISGGEPGPQHYALGGIGILPTLITTLVLIIMESDAIHQANSARVPDWLAARYPPPQDVIIEDEASAPSS